MEDIERKREAVKTVYPNSDTWHEKVDKMSSSQVAAIYIRFVSEGKLGR